MKKVIKMSIGIGFISIIIFSLLTYCGSDNKNKNNSSFSNTHSLDSLLLSAVENQEIPCATAFISINGEMVYHKGFGFNNIESGEKLDKTDIFRIASMTKSVTSVATMQLIEKGLLSLDDRLSKYLPEFKNPTVLIDLLPDSTFTSKPAKSEITIRQLLTHTSGIGYGFQSEIYNAMMVKNGISEGFEEKPITTRENMKRLAEIPLLHDPGEKYTYSMSMDVMGAVIEVVAGESLDKYYYDNIFEPLGMKDTYFIIPTDEADRLVTVYEYNNDKSGFIKATYPMTQYPVQGAHTFLSGGADLSSTVKDIGILGEMLLNKGTYNGVKIIEPASVDIMTSRQSEHNWWDYDIGFGVSVVTKAGAEQKKLMSEGAYDWGGFFDTYGWVDQQKGMVAILFLQMYPTNEYEIHQKFQHITYEIINDYE